jgi:hypothetical protein
MNYAEKRIAVLKRQNKSLRYRLLMNEEFIQELLCQNQALLQYKLKEMLDENIISKDNLVIGYDENKVQAAIMRWSEFK